MGALPRNRCALQALRSAFSLSNAPAGCYIPHIASRASSIAFFRPSFDPELLSRGISSLSAAAQRPDLSDGGLVTAAAVRHGLQHYGRCYWELSKARLSMLVVMTSGAGYVLGSGASVNLTGLSCLCAGTMLAAASANSFNQIIEIANDSGMKRTMRRPLPSGRISVQHAFAWALSSGFIGVSLLASQTNSLAAILGAGNILLYTMAYTPLKQLHPVNTWVGAVVGAVPPLMGWAAASGQLDPGAWVLAAALYFWQLPHFMALSFMCEKDYIAGGYKMVSGRKAALVGLRNCFYLLPVGFAAHYAGVTSSYVAVEALALTVAMGYSGSLFYQNPTTQTARHLFRSSLLYLPLLMLAMLVHRVPNTAAASAFQDEEQDNAEGEATELERLQDPASKLSPCLLYSKPPIAYASAAPFPFLPVPKFP